jgi:hypothetical protein
MGAPDTLVLDGADVLSLKLSARICTRGDDTACGGHAAATGVLLYFDALDRASRLNAVPGGDDGGVPTAQ